jgi:hypothetical protein
MIRTQIQLTEEQSRRLKQLAEQDNVSVAELVRRSVDRYLRDRQYMPPEERRERLLSVAGIGRSGVTDLGESHDRHLAEIYTGAGK